MTTIAVTDDVKQMLLRVASELQLRLGRKVDFNDAIRYLIMRESKKPELLEIASKPVHGFNDAYRELMEERRRGSSFSGSRRRSLDTRRVAADR